MLGGIVPLIRVGVARAPAPPPVPAPLFTATESRSFVTVGYSILWQLERQELVSNTERLISFGYDDLIKWFTNFCSVVQL